MVELAQPRKLLPRWPGHGDLALIIDATNTVYLRAEHVEALAGVPRWETDSALIAADWPVDVVGVPHYVAAAAIAKCEQHGTALALEFISWLRTFLDQVDDVVLEQAHAVVPFVDAYPVARAAELLDRDPAISIGRDRLFRHLEQLGWIERNTPAHDWVITHHAHQRDLLTYRNVRVPAPTRAGYRLYPQVHVTAAGLDELRSTLHGLGRGDPTPEHPITPLF